MKRILLLLLVGLFPPAWAQQLKVTLKSVTVAKAAQLSPALKNSLRGLSAIEYRANAIGKEYPEQWTIVSDRNNEGDLSGIFNSDLRDGDINKSFKNPEFINGLKNVESYRWNEKLQTYFFALEERRESKIGMFTKRGTVKILFPVGGFNSKLTENRGVEGLTFAPNGDLWYSFESGGNSACEDAAFTVFRKLTYNSGQRDQYSPDRQSEYKYPINRCACLANERFGPDNGNGVSEILSYDDSHLLVLERCYRENHGNTVNLFLAKIDEKEHRLIKGNPIFSFNDPENFKGVEKYQTPDNIEGMTWGPNVGNKRTLYLVSDANFRDSQRTQLYVLHLEKGQKAAPSADTGTKRELTNIWGDLTSMRNALKFTKVDKDCWIPIDTKAVPEMQEYTVVAPTAGMALNSMNHIGFGEDGPIISKLPAVLPEGNDLAISIVAEPIVATKTALGKVFSISQNALTQENATRDQILPLLGYTTTELGTAIKKQFDKYYKPFVEMSAPYAVSLNGEPISLVYSKPNFVGHSTIKHSDKGNDVQTVLLTQPRLDKQFLQLAYTKSSPEYVGWEKYKITFRDLYSGYIRQAAEINRLDQKKMLLETAGEVCKCGKYDFDMKMIADSLCEVLNEIKVTQIQLCAIATRVIEENKCWISSWLWYTGGQPKLNPFLNTVAAEYNALIDRRLAVYEEQLKMYQGFARFYKNEELGNLEAFLEKPITKLAGAIADLKTAKKLAPKREETYGKWLLEMAETRIILNKAQLNATEKASSVKDSKTINWMKHFDAAENYTDINAKLLKFKSPLPERMYDGDRMHVVVHNLIPAQKLNAVETVTETVLQTPVQRHLDPTFSLLEKVFVQSDFLTKMSIQGTKVKIVADSLATDSLATDSIAIDSVTSESVDLACNLHEGIACFRASHLLIEWLNDQTEPPLVDMAKAYNAFDIADAIPAYQSKQTLTSKSQSATGTNTVAYEIFEHGNDKPVIKNSYQTYETVRWWPFVSANYVFGSRSTVIFDNTTNSFKTYTGIDNFEVFAGVKWYFGPTNVTRTAKGTTLIRKSVGKYYKRERGNGFGGKTFLFGGLGIRHKFLKNYGAGVGVDIAPGFSLNCGVNIYFDKKYELVNGIVRKDVDVARFRGFIGVSIDANVVTRFIDLF